MVRWYALLVALLVAVAYVPALDAPFLFDDQNSIVNNPTIRQLVPIDVPLSPPKDTPVAGRPLVNVSFALTQAIAGAGVRGYHVGNVALHIGAALLLFGLVRRALRLPGLREVVGADAAPLAFAVALLWGLHPLQSEAVNYLSQRTELLMGLFYLLTLYAALRALDARGSGWTATAIVACAAGMASKESMVTAPVMVALIDRCLVFGSWREAFARRGRLYGALAATWLLLGALLATVPRTSAGFGSGTSPWVYLLNQAQLIPRYLWLSVWPRALVLDYGLPRPLAFGDVLPGFVLLAVLGVLTVVALWRAPRLGLLGAWFFVTLSPASSLVPVSTEVGAERRMYLPLAGLVVLVVWGLWWLLRGGRESSESAQPADETTWTRPRLVGAGLLAVMVLGMLVGLTLRNGEYASPLTMARTIVERWPNGRGHFLYASELVAAGRRDEGLAEFRASATDYPGALFAIGTEQVAGGQVEQGIATLEQFLRAMPTHPTAVPARELLARAYVSVGRTAEAEAVLRQLLQQMPGHAVAHRLLGDLQMRAGRPADAVSEYRAALTGDPAHVPTLSNLGFALAASRRYDEAITVFQQAVSLAPRDAATRNLLARAFAAKGDYQSAGREFSTVLQIDPNNAEARASLGALQRGGGAPAAAPAAR